MVLAPPLTRLLTGSATRRKPRDSSDPAAEDREIGAERHLVYGRIAGNGDT